MFFLKALNVSTSTVRGAQLTVHDTSSVQGGVVREPEYLDRNVISNWFYVKRKYRVDYSLKDAMLGNVLFQLPKVQRLSCRRVS